MREAFRKLIPYLRNKRVLLGVFAAFLLALKALGIPVADVTYNHVVNGIVEILNALGIVQ